MHCAKIQCIQQDMYIVLIYVYVPVFKLSLVIRMYRIYVNGCHVLFLLLNYLKGKKAFILKTNPPEVVLLIFPLTRSRCEEEVVVQPNSTVLSTVSPTKTSYYIHSERRFHLSRPQTSKMAQENIFLFVPNLIGEFFCFFFTVSANM